MSFWADEDVYASPRVGDDDDRASVGSALRKTRSVDASCLDVRSIGDLGSPTQGLSRAKSDFNLQASSNNDDQGKLSHFSNSMEARIIYNRKYITDAFYMF